MDKEDWGLEKSCDFPMVNLQEVELIGFLAGSP